MDVNVSFYFPAKLRKSRLHVGWRRSSHAGTKPRLRHSSWLVVLRCSDHDDKHDLMIWMRMRIRMMSNILAQIESIPIGIRRFEVGSLPSQIHRGLGCWSSLIWVLLIKMLIVSGSLGSFWATNLHHRAKICLSNLAQSDLKLIEFLLLLGMFLGGNVFGAKIIVEIVWKLS